jgi:hypothetical protein
MTGTSPIDQYHAAKPTQFRILGGLEVSQSLSRSSSSWQVSVRMILRRVAGTGSLVLTFTGVTELAFRPQGMPMSMGVLNIEDLSDSHWEGVRYRVKDIEQEDTFSCLCAEFSIDQS